jgi:F-type H+-transporting ATPase subunit a
MEEHHATWVNALEYLVPESARGFVNVNVISAWLVILALVTLAWLGTRRMELRPTRRAQVIWEYIVESFLGFCEGVIGPGGARFAPFLGTLFLYIVGLNLLGVIPGFVSPTASLVMTFALSIPTIIYVQIIGWREQGWRYVMHFVGEPWWLAPLNIPIHVIGEIARPLSLAVRLFGNIFGEDTVIAQLLVMSAALFAKFYIPLPLHFPMILFHIFVSFVQALVFMMLAAAYIGGALPHDEHAHEDGHAPACPAPDAA